VDIRYQGRGTLPSYDRLFANVTTSYGATLGESSLITTLHREQTPVKPERMNLKQPPNGAMSLITPA
jgi:hypothetical protein